MQDGDQNGYQYLTENFKDPRDFPFVFKKIMVQTNIKVLKNRSSCKKVLNDIGNRDSKKDNFMK